MIIAKRKPIEEIVAMLDGKKRVLNLGCGGCTTVCLAGGLPEVEALNGLLMKKCAGTKIDGYTIERQCESEFIEEIDDKIKVYDAIISMGCGAGTQLISERYPDIPVYPAVNTVFLGVQRGVGWYEERCRSCGDCQLGYTGGTCPRTRCAKTLVNGPCGGTRTGELCEVGEDIPCAWCEIIERLKKQNRLEDALNVRPPMSFEDQQGLEVVQDEHKHRYEK